MENANASRDQRRTAVGEADSGISLGNPGDTHPQLVILGTDFRIMVKDIPGNCQQEWGSTEAYEHDWAAALSCCSRPIWAGSPNKTQNGKSSALQGALESNSDGGVL